MAELLTIEDKVSVINQHKKNLEYSKYNIELSILEESSISTPDQELLNSYNSQMAEVTKRIKVLDDELASITPIE